MATKKDIRKNEKDKFRHKYRVLKELRFWLAGLLAVSLVLSAWMGVFTYNKTVNAFDVGTGKPFRETVVFSTTNTDISLMSFSYYFYDSLYGIIESDNFIRDYRAYGLDPTKPLKSLEYTALRSWFDELVETSSETAEEMIRYASLAKKNGLKLSAEENKYIDSEIARLKDRADKEGMAFNDYLDYRYGAGMTEKDVRAALTTYKLAEKQYGISLEKLQECSDKELSDYYYEHRSELETLDFITYRFELKERADAVDLEKAFAACKTPDEFLALIKEDLPKAGCPAEQVEGVLSDCQKRLNYGTDSPFADWAFEGDRKKGDILTREADGYCEVYYLVRPGGKYSFPSGNLRALLVNTEAYGNDQEKAKAKAEELYKLAVENGSEEFFEELVKKYSNDYNTSYYGGKYENVVPGDLAEEFSDWIFADGRKAGDITVIESRGSYNILYYTGDGEECWKASARTALVDERVSEFTKNTEEEIPIEMNQIAVMEKLADNLATDHTRDYSVEDEGGVKIGFSLYLCYAGCLLCLLLNGALLAATIYGFVSTSALKKKYGFTN